MIKTVLFNVFLLRLLRFYLITKGTVSNSFQNISKCGILTCVNNARCVNKSDGKSYCQCHGGYTGITCGNDLDECSIGDPCIHRGYCVNTVGSYRCKCLDGWSGENAHCFIKNNSTTNRKCMPGWIGEWCHDQCLNDSMCRETEVCKKRGSGLRCLCAPGWHGINCTTDIDECFRNPCSDNTECVNTPGSYKCHNMSGWKGINCDEDINECLTNQCRHLSICSNAPGYYNCTCKLGWDGVNFDEDIDECVNNPCNNSLNCYNTPGSFSCSDIHKQGIQDEKRTYIIVGSVIGVVLLAFSVVISLMIMKYKWKSSNCNANVDEPKM